MIKGCKLADAYVNDKKVFVFEFDGDKQKLKKLAIEYLNSDCAMFDAQIKNLKKILQS